jgi:hypothetical protein
MVLMIQDLPRQIAEAIVDLQLFAGDLAREHFVESGFQNSVCS